MLHLIARRELMDYHNISDEELYYDEHPEEMESEAYCPHCGYIDDLSVTYFETCDVCGEKVEWR